MLLVTGGAGYIGSHIIQAWLAAHPDEQVLVWDNFSTGQRATLAPFGDRVLIRETHLTDPEAMAHWLAHFEVDTVIHCAASSVINACEDAPVSTYHHNVTTTLHLADALLRARVRRLVLASSASVYGAPNKQVPFKETLPLRPTHVYGASKAMAELALQAMAANQPLHVLALRYFNVAGCDPTGLLGENHPPETHLIPTLLQRLAMESPKVVPIHVAGEEKQPCVRDYVHVSDVAQAHVVAVDKMRREPWPAGFQAINLGRGEGVSVPEVITACQQVAGGTLRTRTQPVETAPWLVADRTRAQRWLDWSPQYDLTDMIRHAWAFQQEQLRPCVETNQFQR